MKSFPHFTQHDPMDGGGPTCLIEFTLYYISLNLHSFVWFYMHGAYAVYVWCKYNVSIVHTRRIYYAYNY